LERRGFGKRVRRNERRGEKRKTTPVSIYTIGKVKNPLDFHPEVDIRFVRI